MTNILAKRSWKVLISSMAFFLVKRFLNHSWWRHQMETFSALLAICAGNSPVPGEFPTQRPVTRSFDVYFDLRPEKWLSKQSWGWWFETLTRSLWRHRNVLLWVGIHWSSAHYPYNGPVTRTIDVSLVLAWTNCWIHIPVFSSLRQRDGTVMCIYFRNTPMRLSI